MIRLSGHSERSEESRVSADRGSSSLASLGMTNATSAFAGHLDLEAAALPGGRTVVARQSFRAPFHLGKAYWDGRVLQARVVNPTAGILAGDRLDLRIRVRGGAAFLVTTPAATRAFMMRGGSSAHCRQAFTVESGGWLEYAPEPLYPHRDSDYDQATRLEVAGGGEAYFVDALAPGRAGRGETWAWRRLRIDLDVVHAGEPVLVERLAEAGAEAARRAAFFGMPEAWIATAVAISPRLDADEAFWSRVRDLHSAGRWVGATRLRKGGWIVRMIAPSGLSLRDGLTGLRSLLSEKLPGLCSDLRRL
jgi:urease accessory protein